MSGGTLWIDGGNMFGVVPRILWEHHCPPDDQHRVLLDTNCLVVDGPGGLVLVDTGYGSKCPQKLKLHHSLEEGNPLVENLAAERIHPEDVDVVILTHLHFDHVGGATQRNGAGELIPTFPRARYYVQRREWDDATAGLPELSGAYFPEDFVMLDRVGAIERIEGDVQIVPGIRTRLAGGHTRGHQIVDLGAGDERAVYLADLCPFTAHLRAAWTMAYDQFPLETRRTKPKVLGEAADRGWPVLFGHDPEVRAARLTRDPRREFVVGAEITV